MRVPPRWKQSRWLRWLKPVKRWLISPPPPPPPVLAPSLLTGIVPPPPPVSPLSASERASLFQTITRRDLSDQISAPDIALRVVQIFNSLSREIPEFPGGQPRLNRDPSAPEKSWDSWHALTWYALRFRPRTFLELGGGIGQTTAMVGLNSPRTTLVCFDTTRDVKVRLDYFFPTEVRRELARCGFHEPITFVAGNSHRTVPYYFSGASLRSRRRGQLRTREFDLLFVNGVRQSSGIYRDLKNAFAHCALGGLVVLQLPEPVCETAKGRIGDAATTGCSLPVSPCLRSAVSGMWERIQRHFRGFRYFVARDFEVGLAFRIS